MGLRCTFPDVTRCVPVGNKVWEVAGRSTLGSHGELQRVSSGRDKSSVCACVFNFAPTLMCLHTFIIH